MTQLQTLEPSLSFYKTNCGCAVLSHQFTDAQGQQWERIIMGSAPPAELCLVDAEQGRVYEHGLRGGRR